MTFRTLIPSYLESNHIDTLRYELCEILYSDYKGSTFTLVQQLEEKKMVLQKLHNFINQHPEISQYKEDTQYWYPYQNVDGSKNLRLYDNFYPNADDEITYFCKEGDRQFEKYEYLFDPVKMCFILMSQDIRKMDCKSDLAQEIITINNELFGIIYNTVGDTINYSGLNTLEYINQYLKNEIDEQTSIENDMSHTADYKQMLLRSCHSFNDFSYLLNNTILICNEDKLQKELPEKAEVKTKNKI